MLRALLLVLTLAAQATSKVIGDAQISHVSPNNEARVVDDERPNSHTLFGEYPQKICDDYHTCSLGELVHQSSLDLRYLNCMCDDDCIMYNDCCSNSSIQDVQITQHNFSCEKTTTNDFVYMKTLCPSSWNKWPGIRAKCEISDPLQPTLDISIRTPVTNFKTGITYRNKFCAICNDEFSYKFWDWGLTCEIPNGSEQFKFEELPHLEHSILENLHPKNKTSPWLLESVVDNRTYDCWYHVEVPDEEFSTYLRYCVPFVVDTCSSNWTGPSTCPDYTYYTYADDGIVYKNPECVTCNYVNGPTTCKRPSRPVEISSKIQLKIEDSRLIQRNISYCHQIPKHFGIYKRFCPDAAEPAPPISQSDCKESWKYCPVDKYFNTSSDFELLKNGKIIHVIAEGNKFSRDEYFLLDDTTVYICGYTHLTTTIEQLSQWLSVISQLLSIICLVAHLFVFQQLPQMRTLPQTNLAILSIIYLLLLVHSELYSWLPDVIIKAMIQHYLWLSCFMWLLIMSYDCWRSISNAIKKLPAPDGSQSSKHIIYYCILGVYVPFLVVGVSAFFDLSPQTMVPCNLKPGYTNEYDKFISGTTGSMIFLGYPVIIMLMGVNLFCTHIAVMIIASKHSTDNPPVGDDFKLYTRLAIMVGLQFPLYIFLAFYHPPILKLLYVLILNSQGIFIFFGFTVNKERVEQLRVKHKNNPIILRYVLMKSRQENV